MHHTTPTPLAPAPAADPSWTRTRPKPGSQHLHRGLRPAGERPHH